MESTDNPSLLCHLGNRNGLDLLVTNCYGDVRSKAHRDSAIHSPNQEIETANTKGKQSESPMELTV